MRSEEESSLVQRLYAPDTREAAFRELLNLYQKRVYYLMRKMVLDHSDADDLTQDTFVKVYCNLDTFRAEAGLFTWIYRIGANEALSFLQKKKRRAYLLRQEYNPSFDSYLEQPGTLSGDESLVLLHKAILTLPDKQRLVFHMRYFDELTYEEMSTAVGTSVGALKASYHHAVKKIEAYIGRQLN